MAPSGVLGAIFQAAKNVEQIPNSTILVLGAAKSGKKTLIRGLQAASKDAFSLRLHQKRGTDLLGALDFMYVEVRNVSQYDSWTGARAAVWLLDDINYKEMLSSRLEHVDLRYTAAYICLDAETPWLMMAELSKWFDLLQEFSQSKMIGMRFAEQDVIRRRLADSLGVNQEDIVYNLGFPVYVTVNKSDGWEPFEPNVLEAISFHLRSACLPYMATITCVEDKQAYFDVLYGYVMKHLYGFHPGEHIQMQMNDVRWDGFWHIPAGADSLALLSPLQDTNPLCAEDRPFESIVKAPTGDSRHDVQPVVAEESEAFLLRLKDLNPKDVKMFFAGLIDQKQDQKGRRAVSSPDHSPCMSDGGSFVGSLRDATASTAPLAGLQGRLASHRHRLLAPSHSRHSILEVPTKRPANDSDSDSGSDRSPSDLNSGAPLRSSRLQKLMKQNTETRKAKKYATSISFLGTTLQRTDSAVSAMLSPPHRLRGGPTLEEAESACKDSTRKGPAETATTPPAEDGSATTNPLHDAVIAAALARVKLEAGEDDADILATEQEDEGPDPRSRKSVKSVKSGMSKFTTLSRMSSSHTLGQKALSNKLKKGFQRSVTTGLKDDSDEEEEPAPAPPPHTQWYREQADDAEDPTLELSPLSSVSKRLADELHKVVRKKNTLSEKEKRDLTREKLSPAREDREARRSAETFFSAGLMAPHINPGASPISNASVLTPPGNRRDTVDPHSQPDPRRKDLSARIKLREMSLMTSGAAMDDASPQVSEEPKKAAADTAVLPATTEGSKSAEPKLAARSDPSNVARTTPRTEGSKSAEPKLAASSDPSSMARTTPRTEGSKSAEPKLAASSDPSNVARTTPRTEGSKSAEPKLAASSDPRNVAEKNPVVATVKGPTHLKPSEGTAGQASNRSSSNSEMVVPGENACDSIVEHADRIPQVGRITVPIVVRPKKIGKPSTPENAQSGVRVEVRNELTRLKALSKKTPSKGESLGSSPGEAVPADKPKALLRTAEDARKELERLRAKANKGPSASKASAGKTLGSSGSSGALAPRPVPDARLELERLKAKAYTKPSAAAPSSTKKEDTTKMTSEDFRAKLEALKQRK